MFSGYLLVPLPFPLSPLLGDTVVDNVDVVEVFSLALDVEIVVLVEVAVDNVADCNSDKSSGSIFLDR